MNTTTEPLIISASRATDIPAFHGEWFSARLQAGFCTKRNAFNSKEETVSFAKTRVFVFWTKNPAPFLRYLPEIEATGRQFYFQFTLNDYEREGLEPRLPRLQTRINTFKRLADTIGPHRVIWRFDPIIMGGSLSVESVLDRIDRIGRELSPYTEKLVFSFVDMYSKTAGALHQINRAFHAPTQEEIQSLAAGLAAINKTWPRPLTLTTCAEETDLRSLGIQRNKCIDDALIRRLCPNDQVLASLLDPPDRQLTLLPTMTTAPKDKGQRKHCGCIPSKDIGAYSTCLHACAYCYANGLRDTVDRNMRAARENAATATGLLP